MGSQIDTWENRNERYAPTTCDGQVGTVSHPPYSDEEAPRREEDSGMTN
jgi:hypothetical protein